MKKILSYHPVLLLSLAASCFLILNQVNAATQNLTVIGTNSVPVVSNANSYFNITNLSYQLVLTHIRIWNSQWNIDLMNLNLETDILDTINTAEILVKTDIIQALKVSKDRSSTLRNYLDKISNTISKLEFFDMLVTQTVENSKTDMATCIAEKKVADQAYFRSLDYYDQPSLIQSLQKSISYDKCISKAKITINANNAVLKKLTFYKNLLQTKFTYLFEKQDTILKNINVIDQQLLQELQNIDKTLTKYNQ